MVNNILICSLFILTIGSFTVSDVFADDHIPYVKVIGESIDGVNYSLGCETYDPISNPIETFRMTVHLVDINKTTFTDPGSITEIFISNDKDDTLIDNVKLVDGAKFQITCNIGYGGDLIAFGVGGFFPVPKVPVIDSFNLIATPGDSEATLSWNEPSHDSIILAYILDISTNGKDWQYHSVIINDGNNQSIIVKDLDNNTKYFFKLTTVPVSDTIESNIVTVTPSVVGQVDGNKPGGGCGNCVPPTLGLDLENKRLVDNGFSYNNNPTQVEFWHTPYPLITAKVGEMNKVEILVYEDVGIHNLNLVQFGLGATHLGQPLHELEVLVELHFETDNTTHGIKISDVTIRDDDNLIENTSVSADVYVTECMDDIIKEECVKITLEYFYREAPINHMMVVSASDKHRNTQMFYFNHGVKVIGESLNESPTYTMYNKQHAQQIEDLTLTLTRVDKVNHIWEDEHEIKYLQISEHRFDRITTYEPTQCTDKPLSEVNVPTRNNCHFRELVAFWQ